MLVYLYARDFCTIDIITHDHNPSLFYFLFHRAKIVKKDWKPKHWVVRFEDGSRYCW